LEEAMDVIERRTMSLRKPSKHWNIPLTSLSDHLYKKTRSKKPTTNRCIKNEYQLVVLWVLAIQDVGLSISLQQLKMKVVKLTQTRPTPFQGIVRTS
jgi:hypothetical protein